MKTVLTNTMITCLILSAPWIAAMAQDKKEQIKIQITKEVDGEVKTFERSYDSKAAMQADAELEEFIGKAYTWPQPDDKSGAGYFADSLDEKTIYAYHFDEEFANHLKMLRPSDSSLKKLKALAENFETLLAKEAFTIHFDEDFDIRFNDSLSSEIRARIRAFQQEKQTTHHWKGRKNISVTEEVDAFGKLGKVKEDERLDLSDLSFFPNPSPSGRLQLRFSVPEAGELSIKLYDIDGKQIFNRYLADYAGHFSESINLSHQQAGIFLLEISLDDKRLTRKLIID